MIQSVPQLKHTTERKAGMTGFSCLSVRFLGDCANSYVHQSFTASRLYTARREKRCKIMADIMCLSREGGNTNGFPCVPRYNIAKLQYFKPPSSHINGTPGICRKIVPIIGNRLLQQLHLQPNQPSPACNALNLPSNLQSIRTPWPFSQLYVVIVHLDFILRRHPLHTLTPTVMPRQHSIKQ